jgi:N-acetylglucosamine-6-sulfatase
LYDLDVCGGVSPVLTRGRLRVVAGLVGVVLIVGAIVALVETGGSSRQTSSVAGKPPSSPSPSGAGGAAARPNIVFVLTDDLSMNLVRFMPHVRAMERAGLTFKNYFVSDSLCCPSRASIFTGAFPHDTGVFSNFGAGWRVPRVLQPR